MCKNCGDEHGAPVPVTDLMREARVLMDAIYAEEWGGSGAALHIHLDDSNIEDAFFNADSRLQVEKDWSTYWASEAPPEGLALCLRTFDAFVPLTEAERATVVDWPELFAS